MAIPRKGARQVVVEAVTYRWSVRPRPTYSQAIGTSPLSFAVELASSGGTTLVVTVDSQRPDSWVSEKRSVVTPALVELAVKRALRQGWRPAENGAPYALSLYCGEA
jgi:hypothetical protein